MIIIMQGNRALYEGIRYRQNSSSNKEDIPDLFLETIIPFSIPYSPMKQIYLFIALCLLFSLQACKEQPVSESQYNALATQIEALREIVTTPANKDSLLRTWMRLNGQPLVQKDTALYVRTKYNIGRLYAMAGNDSAQMYIEQAMERIDPAQGLAEEKAQVYNGMGNIWNSKNKEHQANHYYNKAAMIVLADSTIDLSPSTKTIVLLAAAQSNENLLQYGLALQMNRAALALIPKLPAGHPGRQRALVQMIQNMNTVRAPADSIKGYLDQMESLHRQFPDDYDISYLYECKTKYFERSNQLDSLLHYQLLKSEVDREWYQQKPPHPTRINNLFISYCNIAGTYMMLQRPDKAALYLTQAGQIKKEHQDVIAIDNLIIYNNDLAVLYDMQGRKQEAINLLFETDKLQKNNYQTQNTQAVAEMNSLYQLQSKDRSIRALNASIKIKKLQLQQNNLWLIVAILTAILLALSILFLYYRSRQRRAVQEKEKALMQQQLLRAQMEPHFIFNTLAAVQSFVRLDQKETAISYLNRFSRLLRSSLELSREKLVPLEEEIEMLENYLSLQQMRFEHAFSYQLLQPEEQDLEAIMLPPMLIQPYVENAILHGIDMEQDKGNIAVHFRIEKEILEVTITDSGKQSGTRTDPTHRSLSGAISRERIHLLGKHARVTSIAIPGQGTIVTLRIPIVY